jgi:transcription-repair coupling factor (superfamily II helicase)
LGGLQAAARALGHASSKELTQVKKHVLSEAGRAKIAKAAKKRWAKVRAQAKKAIALVQGERIKIEALGQPRQCESPFRKNTRHAKK